jgi:hypothetical protein
MAAIVMSPVGFSSAWVLVCAAAGALVSTVVFGSWARIGDRGVTVNPKQIKLIKKSFFEPLV